MQSQDILQFWFERFGPQYWDQTSDPFDAMVREKFETFLLDEAVKIRRTNSHPWLEQHTDALALILLLGQFPRRIYRATKGEYAFEDVALAAARLSIDKGFDLKTAQDKRWFFYSPFTDAEDLNAQSEGVRLVDMRIQDENLLKQARNNQQTIAKFGRFAERNAVLGRRSTRDEIEFLSLYTAP